MIKFKRKIFQLNWRNYLLFLFSIVLILLALEIGFRIYYYFSNMSKNIILSENLKLVYEHKPSTTFINKYKIIVRFNSLGFIGNEIEEKRGQVRILGIGDSITEATYLEERDRYLNKVGEILIPLIKKPVEIVNGAVAGYNTWQQLELLKTKGLKINPDLIIVGVCLNDSVRYMPLVKKNWFGGIIASTRDGSKARYFDFLYQKSDFYKFIYDRLANRNKRFRNEDEFHKYLKKYEFNISANDWLIWKDALKEIMEIVKYRNIPIIFVIFPLQNQIIRSEAVTFKPLTEFFMKEKVSFVDLIEIFNNEYNRGNVLYLDYDLIHPTKFGHELIAKTISDYILSNKILTVKIK